MTLADGSHKKQLEIISLFILSMKKSNFKQIRRSTINDVSLNKDTLTTSLQCLMKIIHQKLIS